MVKSTTEQASRFYNLGCVPESNLISAGEISFLTRVVMTVIARDLVPTVEYVTLHLELFTWLGKRLFLLYISVSLDDL